MHADNFRQDRYGIVSELRDGGYSDDMTLAAITGNMCDLLAQRKQAEINEKTFKESNFLLISG